MSPCLLACEMWTPRRRCRPEQSRHMKTPRLTDAQRGHLLPQSTHSLFWEGVWGGGGDGAGRAPVEGQRRTEPVQKPNSRRPRLKVATSELDCGAKQGGARPARWAPCGERGPAGRSRERAHNQNGPPSSRQEAHSRRGAIERPTGGMRAAPPSPPRVPAACLILLHALLENFLESLHLLLRNPCLSARHFEGGGAAPQ